MKNTITILSMLLLSVMTYGQAQLHEIFDQVSQDYEEHGSFLLSIDKKRGMLSTQHYEIPRSMVSNDFVVKIRNAYTDAMSTADESNHYEKHAPGGGDLISYSIVTEGKLLNENSPSNFEMGRHRFDLGAKMAANLDIDSATVVMTLSKRIHNVDCQPINPAPIDSFLGTLKDRKDVKMYDISYQNRKGGTAIFSSVNNAYADTCVTTGVRYDFDAAAIDVKAEFERVVMSYVDRKQECIISKTKGLHNCDLGFVLGNFEYVYVANTNKQGKLQLLQVRRNGPNMFVPLEWPDITQYNNGEMK